MELERRAMSGAEAALRRYGSGEDRREIRRLHADHKRHFAQLVYVAEEMGLELQVPAPCPPLLRDLFAMRDAEVELAEMYARVLVRPLPARMRYALEEILAEECAHRAWLDRRVGASDRGRVAALQAAARHRRLA
jgi:hypothetical protein